MELQILSNENKTNIKHLNKKAIIIAGIILAIIIILISTITISARNSKPNKQQLQDDLIQRELNDENLSISEFEIYSEEKIDNKYTAIASVTYEKDNVEYSEKYSLTYSKYDNWEFYDIEGYDKELWTKKPTAQPNVEEYTELCLKQLEEDGNCHIYDSFVFNENNSSCDLESGTAIYAFDVKRDRVIEKRSGEIDFSIKFDFDDGKWYIADTSYSDSYKIETEFIHSWSGTLTCESDSSWYDTEDKKVKFSITEIDKNNIKGQFIFGDQTYDMSGTIDIDESYKIYDYTYDIDMTGKIDKVCRLEGVIGTDGSLYISINRNYTGDGTGLYLYHQYDIFSGDLTLE